MARTTSALIQLGLLMLLLVQLHLGSSQDASYYSKVPAPMACSAANQGTPECQEACDDMGPAGNPFTVGCCSTIKSGDDYYNGCTCCADYDYCKYLCKFAPSANPIADAGNCVQVYEYTTSDGIIGHVAGGICDTSSPGKKVV